jgi:hypothetical protein
MNGMDCVQERARKQCCLRFEWNRNKDENFRSERLRTVCEESACNKLLLLLLSEDTTLPKFLLLLMRRLDQINKDDCDIENYYYSLMQLNQFANNCPH